MRYVLQRFVGMATVRRIAILSSSCPRTLGLGPEVWRVLAKCHELRNLGEYEGDLQVEERIVVDLIAACEKVEMKVLALAPIKEVT